MAIHATLLDAQYQVRPKNSNALEQVNGPTLVSTLESTDLATLDPGRVTSYASPANLRWAGRLITGNPKYWGKGIRSNADLTALLYDGWEEGVTLVSDLSKQVQDMIPRPTTVRRRLVWSDEGSYLCPERLLIEGNLDACWRSFRPGRRQGHRIISIDVDVGQNCYVDADALKWSGVAAVALTDALELAGYRVELFSTSAMKSNTPGGGVALTRMIVKRAQEPLNVGLVASLAAHPATFRWHHVMSWLAHPVSVGGGYGQSAHLPEVLEAAMLAGAIDGSEVQLGGAFSREAALQQITATLDAMGLSEEAAVGTIQ